MATGIGEPVGGARPPEVPPGTPPRSARAILAQKQDPWSRVGRLVIVLLALGILARGWVVTDIDLSKLTNASNAGPILKSLLQPDVAARDVTPIELEVPFVVGEGSTAPASVDGPAGQTLAITPGSATPGQIVAFDGFGFAPDTDGQLRLLNPSRGLDALFLRVHTDAQGAFHDARPWLDYAVAPPDTYTFKLLISAPVGTVHPSETLVSSLSRMLDTILLALMGTAFGVLLSIPLSFLGARNLMNGTAIGRGVYWLVRLVFTVTRSIEVLILGVIMVVIVGIGSYAGVLAIVVHSVGSLGKLYSEAIEGIEPGPIEAITATGANRVQTVLYGVIPQVVPSFMAVTIFWWDHNVRMSTVLGLVGGGGIGFLLIQYINLLQFNQAATVLWLIVMVVAVMDYTSGAIRSRLV